MSKYKKAVFLIVVIGACASLIFWGRIRKNDDAGYEQVEYLIGMSHPNLVDDWQISIHNEMSRRINSLSNTKLIYTNAGGSSFKQISDVNKLREYGIDLLIITVNDVKALSQTLDEIGSEIPVILMDKNIDSKAYSLLIGPDYNQIGQEVGMRIHELSKEQEYRYITIKESIDNEDVAGISNGLQHYIGNYVTIRNAGDLYLDGMQDEEDIRQFLASRSDFDVIYIQTEEKILDIIGILDEMQLKKEVIISTKNISAKYLTYLDIGDIDTIIYTPVGATEAIEYAMEILQHINEDDAVPKRVVMNNFIVTKATKDKFLYSTVIEKNNQIGYIETDLIEEAVVNGFVNEGKEVVYCEMDETDDNEAVGSQQREYFKELLEQQVDMIILRPAVAYGWSDLLVEAGEKAITVVCLGNQPVISDQVNKDYLIYIGPDYEDQGRMVASYLINEVYSTNYDIGILEIVDGVNDSISIKKTESLEAAIKGYSRIDFLAQIQVNIPFEPKVFREELQKAASRFEQDINVIYIHDDTRISLVEDIIKESFAWDYTLISSDDLGILQNSSFIDYEIGPQLLYNKQLELIVKNYYEKGEVFMDSIYLPNNEKINN